MLRNLPRPRVLSTPTSRVVLPTFGTPSRRSLVTDASAIDTVGVVGAGQMGIGIAYVAAKVRPLPLPPRSRCTRPRARS